MFKKYRNRLSTNRKNRVVNNGLSYLLNIANKWERTGSTVVSIKGIYLLGLLRQGGGKSKNILLHLVKRSRDIFGNFLGKYRKN
jgi:hypothetical protein